MELVESDLLGQDFEWTKAFFDTLQISLRKRQICELERQLEMYKAHYSHLDQIFNEITRHLLGPNFYTLASDSWTSLEETKNVILAKYKKVKK